MAGTRESGGLIGISSADSSRASRPILSLCLHFCLFASLARAQDSSPPSTPAASPDVAAVDTDPIADLAALLRRDGPEAAADRERGVVALMRRPEARAHAELQKFLVDPDPDRPSDAAELALRQLVLALGEPGHPAFGAEPVRGERIASWTGALARLFATTAQSTPLESATTPLVPHDADSLRGRAREFLRRLQPTERRRTFEQLGAPSAARSPLVFDGEVLERVLLVELRRALCAMAGETRDVTLVPWLSRGLDDAEIAAAARRALVRLTFVDPPPADSAAFAVWWQERAGSTYVELAERAARESRARVAEVRTEAESQLLEIRAELMRALLAVEDPDWRAIQQQLTAEAPPGNLERQLTVLCKALAPLPGSRPTEPAGLAADRDRLAELLQERLDTDDSFAARALLLEATAYLAPLRTDDQRSALQDQLVAALQSADVALQQAALRGLRRLGGPEVRGRVVEAASRALAEAQPQTLAAALDCLRLVATTAPAPADPDGPAWEQLLDGLLRGSEVTPFQRELAIQLAVIRAPDTAALLPAAFELLERLIRDADAPVPLRKQAQRQLLPHITSESEARSYLAAVLQLASDRDAELRCYGLSVLHDLPRVESGSDSTSAERLRVQATDALTEALSGDESLECVRAAAESMSRLADQKGAGRLQVLGQLAEVASLWREAAAASMDPLSEERRGVIADELRVLGLDPRTTPSGLLVLAEALTVLEAGAPAWELLGRLAEARDLPPDQRLRRARLQLGAADLLGAAALETFDSASSAGSSATAPNAVDLAGPVFAAIDVLEAAGAELTLAQQVVRIEALAAGAVAARDASTGSAPTREAVELTTATIRRATPGDSVRQRLATALVRIHLGRAESDAAETVLVSEGWPPTAMNLSRTAAWADLWIAVLGARASAGGHAEVAATIPEVLQHCAELPSRWRELYLLGVTSRLATPAADRAALAAELAAQEDRFAGESVTAEHRERFEELRRAAGDGG